MKNLFEIFKDLKISREDGSFIVEDIPFLPHHKIGRSKDSFPIFFIKSDVAGGHILNKSFEIISIKFNKECNLYGKKELTERGFFNIITLKSNNIDIQEYFIDIMCILLKKMPTFPSLEDIRNEFNTLVDLFRSFTKPSIKTIQGIWAELLIIEQSNNPDYLTKAWHSSVVSLFDFNDGIDKLEVKCTTNDKRIHRFSLKQLDSNKSSKLFIASVITVETGIGLNIFDLRKKILDKLVDKNLILKIDTIISKTLGIDINKAAETFFDYISAIDLIKIYDFFDVPKIEMSAVPIQITNVKFDSDLTLCKECDMKFINSILISSYYKAN